MVSAVALWHALPLLAILLVSAFTVVQGVRGRIREEDLPLYLCLYVLAWAVWFLA